MDQAKSRLIAELKKKYLRSLARGPVPPPVVHPQENFWSFSTPELDQEMGNRLSSMNEDIDCRPRGPITSHRRLLGPFITWGKRIMRFILTPYSNLLLLRQNRFNEDQVLMNLAAFIRCRRLEEKLQELQRQVDELQNEKKADE